MTTYLVRHKGALGVEWAFLEAPGPEAVAETFAELEVVDPWPEWATPQMVKDVGVYDLTSPASPLLERLRR